MIKYYRKLNRSESRDGMRLVSSGGFNVKIQEYDNVVKIEKEGRNNRIDFVIQVPKNFDIKAKGYNGGMLSVMDVEGEVDVENYNAPITLKDISGVASASTYNAHIVVTFVSITPDKPMAFSTHNGKIDITVPSGTKLTAKMKTDGDIFTDSENFELLDELFQTRETGRERKPTYFKFEGWVQGKLNGGGAEVTMETKNSHIYIREGN